MPCVTSAWVCESCFGLLSERVSCWIDIFVVAYCWAGGVLKWRKSPSVFNHYFHIKCTLPPLSFSSLSHAHTFTHMDMRTHLILTIIVPLLICRPLRSQQNDSCHRVPITPTQQGIKDKQTCGHRKRRKWCVCVCVHFVCPCVSAVELQCE